MDYKPLVSIIVLNYNGKYHIRSCLKSLLNQTYSNYEVMVVDNASIDDSPEIVKKEFPKVQLILNDKNYGFAKGNNIGIKVAKGELIALFNNDAIATPNWLSELVNAITEKSSIGIVGSLIFFHEPSDSIWSAGGRFDKSTGVVFNLHEGRKIKNNIQFTDDIDYIPGTALLVKKGVITKIGLMDEDYFLYYDDLDWCLTMKRAGYNLKIVPSSVVYHKVGASSKAKPVVRTRIYFYQFRSIFHFCFKQLSLQFLLSSLFFQLIVFSLFELTSFKPHITSVLITSKIKAFYWNLRNLKKIMKKRKKVKALGKVHCKNRLHEVVRLRSLAKSWV